MQYFFFLFLIFFFPFSANAKNSAKEDLQLCLTSFFNLEWKKSEELCLLPFDAYMLEAQLKLSLKGKEFPTEDVNSILKPLFDRVVYNVGDELTENGKTSVKLHLKLPDLRPVVFMILGDLMKIMGKQPDQINEKEILTKIKTAFDAALNDPALPFFDTDVSVSMTETENGWRLDASEGKDKLQSQGNKSFIPSVSGSIPEVVTPAKSFKMQFVKSVSGSIPEVVTPVNEDKKSLDAVNTFFSVFKGGDVQKSYDVLALSDKKRYSFADFQKKYGLTENRFETWKGFDYACSRQSVSVENMASYLCHLKRPDINDAKKNIEMDYKVNVIKEDGYWHVDLGSVRKAE